MIQDKLICMSLLLQISKNLLRQEIGTSIKQYGKREINYIMKNTYPAFLRY